jgi:hypothetical protein
MLLVMVVPGAGSSAINDFAIAKPRTNQATTTKAIKYFHFSESITRIIVAMVFFLLSA